MAIWLIRAGSHGEYEQRFIQDSRVYVTWDDLDVDLGKLKDRSDLTEALSERYPDKKTENHPELGEPNLAIRQGDQER